jgi:putative FmdB family regulatory protein
MAIYEFECSACGERFEVTRPMSEHDLLKQEPPPCPKCGAIGAHERAPLINTKPPSS